jgi:hypothetical protein
MTKRRTCLHCGESLADRRSDAQFCSVSCTQNARYHQQRGHPISQERRQAERAVKNCLACGKSLIGRDLRTIVCSNLCWQRFRKGRKFNPLPPKQCIICEKPFVPRGNAKFCSEDCFIEHRCERKRREYRSKVIYKPPGECIVCGREFEAERWASQRKLCSKICQNIHHMDRYYRPEVHARERERNNHVKIQIRAFRKFLQKYDLFDDLEKLPHENQIRVVTRLARKMGIFDNQPIEQLRDWIITQVQR